MKETSTSIATDTVVTKPPNPRRDRVRDRSASDCETWNGTAVDRPYVNF